MNIKKWTDWPLSVHTEKEQIDLQLKLLDNDAPKEYKVKFKQKSVNKEKQTAETEDGYITTPVNCNCDYFLTHHKPCKHIYALALKLEIYKPLRKFLRSENLCADFSNGFAAGWAFGVGTFHWPCLDIQNTKFYKDKKLDRIVPTQAADYRFDVGMIFYNYAPAIYTPGSKWADALEYIKVSLQIHAVNPNAVNIEYIANYDNGILKIKPVQNVKYGMIIFDVFTYEPNKPKKLNRYHARANELVKLLQYGHCTCIRNSEKEDLNLTKFLNR